MTTATTQQLQEVLAAAESLLSARADDMLTVEEWAGLARAVAGATGCKAADLLGGRDLRAAAEERLAWDQQADGPLPGSDL
ncbi:hypothetical protein [Actinomadura sp.]|uniref:hypothetical protein n=1 Tax=Actinomadura sp. TaxID=1989 RepID=UPI0037C63140